MSYEYRSNVWYYAAGVILCSNSKYLLVKQKETGIWSFPKGGPEPQDCKKALKTAIREVFEETGLKINKHYKLRSKQPSQFPNKHLYQFADVVNKSEEEVKIMDDGIEEQGWFSGKEMKEMSNLNFGIRYFVSRI